MVERSIHQIVEEYLGHIEEEIERERRAYETRIAIMDSRLNEALDYACKRIVEELERRDDGIS